MTEGKNMLLKSTFLSVIIRSIRIISVLLKNENSIQ